MEKESYLEKLVSEYKKARKASKKETNNDSDVIKGREALEFMYHMASNIARNVGRVKSIRRAMKRGRLTPMAALMPKRPFNNRANTCKRKGHNSRMDNQLKKQLWYGRINREASKQSI